MRARKKSELRQIAYRRSARAQSFLQDEGSQLVEFALALPILLFLTVGLLDFGTAFNLRQILNNAAREGARMGSSQPTVDLTQPPCTSGQITNCAYSVQVVHDAVVAYLANANVDTSFISTTMNPADPGTFTWCAYSAGSCAVGPGASSGTYGLRIEREVVVPNGAGPKILSTRVTLIYPYNWTYGFNNVANLALPGANYSSTIALDTDATMPNQQ